MNKVNIISILKTIPDPELGISIWDLGLIYGIEINKKTKSVTIRMTLTSIGCPLFNLIADPIKESIKGIKGVKEVYVELTFEPPWTIDRMSPEARAQMGI